MTLFEECKELLKADFDVVERDDRGLSTPTAESNKLCGVVVP